MNEVCRICGNERDNRVHKAREMGFGTREEFPYLECGRCGCVQLLQIPADMSRYYPPGYYSLQPHGVLKTFVRRQWSAHAFGRSNPVGWLFSELFFVHRPMLAVRRINPEKTAGILDVGCGCGYLLQDLARLGFKNLTGADPFIAQDLVYQSGVKIFKKQIGQVPGQFDLIMLHHSFEHMANPADVLSQVAERLKQDGKVILGIPVASSYAWKRYGVNWVNLDAPRHFYLHTYKSIEFLCSAAGLRIDSIVQEGNDEQFWASEQFERDIPSNDPRSIGSTPVKRLLAWGRIRACKAKAEELNRQQEADLVCFHLAKPA